MKEIMKMKEIRFIGLKPINSFAEYSLFCRALLQKRLLILRSLIDPKGGDILQGMSYQGIP